MERLQQKNVGLYARDWGRVEKFRAEMRAEGGEPVSLAQAVRLLIRAALAQRDRHTGPDAAPWRGGTYASD